MLHAVIRRWPLLVAVPVLFGLAAHGVLQVLPPRYKASAQLLIFDPQRSAVVAVGQNAPAARELDAVSINTEIEVIRSASALERAARKLRLDQVAEFQDDGLFDRLRSPAGVPGEGLEAGAVPDGPGTAALARAVLALRKRISAERVPASYILVLSATAGDPLLAQRLVSTLLDDYLEEQAEASHRALVQVAGWLQGKMAELQARIGDTNVAIEHLRADAGIAEGGKGTMLQQQIAETSSQLAAIRTELADKKSRLEQAREGRRDDDNRTAVPDGLFSPALSQLRQQFSLLRREVVQLREKLGDRHAQVLAAEDRLATLRRAISDELAHIAEEQQASFEIAQRRETSLIADLQRLRARQIDDDGAVGRLQELQRAVEADTRLYQTYSARLEEVEAVRSLGASGKRVLSPPGVPTEPSFPRKKMIYAGAIAAGGLVGLALATVLARLRRGIPAGGPAQSFLGQPILGNLPLLKGRPDPRAIGRMVAAAWPVGEAARAIRVALRLRRQGNAPRMVVVTSALRGEGRSTLAAAIAASASQAGLRVVLVEGGSGARTPSAAPQGRRDGAGHPGPDLAGAASVQRHDPDIGCCVTTLGSGPADDAEALMSDELVCHLGQLRSEFDLVVVDAPPLLPVPDALSLARDADAFLLVINSRRTSPALVAEAIGLLDLDAHCLVGLVLNMQPQASLQRLGLAGGRRAPRGEAPPRGPLPQRPASPERPAAAT
ncbi:GumC family protein [Paracraurococcus lichenis]|uniref:Exopolysaccharide transport family protein n=1 Tax=Paracraurococcus lichenis TaxID=3064888 RepID=A0ABT9E9B3_9PROT|nr:exopolysaccharide transport family protein [Paracraurococcus sp. LOR1-02]MDO9712568.1 exopolysaccharide transport family protein [Paracraurococcus sp. LOR1-02]